MLITELRIEVKWSMRVFLTWESICNQSKASLRNDLELFYLLARETSHFCKDCWYSTRISLLRKTIGSNYVSSLLLFKLRGSYFWHHVRSRFSWFVAFTSVTPVLIKTVLVFQKKRLEANSKLETLSVLVYALQIAVEIKPVTSLYDARENYFDYIIHDLVLSNDSLSAKAKPLSAAVCELCWIPKFNVINMINKLVCKPLILSRLSKRS